MRIGCRLPNLFLAGLSVLVAGALTAATAEPRGGTAPSTKEQTLYDFCSQTNCVDGMLPIAGLIMDGAGNLYGTALGGVYDGAAGAGTVFQLTPTNTGWSEKVPYSFCSESNCADGHFPIAGLIMDASGSLYGTTNGGGACTYNIRGCGVVFQLRPTGTGWSEQVLYNFCSQSNCVDGQGPNGGLIMDASGNLYGTTAYGGTAARSERQGAPTPTAAAWCFN
jgi:hypothetical protein